MGGGEGTGGGGSDTCLMLKVLIISSETSHGAPMTTSSTYRQDSTPSTRSCRFIMGKLLPLYLFTTSSLCTPTIRKSPKLLALFKNSTCALWSRSNAPSTYTTRSVGFGLLLLENSAILLDVGMKLEKLPSAHATLLLGVPPVSSLTGER
eukprot:749753-Hanusia_phi.AAC.2